MLFINSPDGRTVYHGPEWPELTGQALAASLGRCWLECIHREDRNLVEDIHNKGIETRSEYSMRYRLLTPDGSFRWMVAGAHPSFGPPDHTVSGFLGSMVLLTDVPTNAMRAYGSVARYVAPPPPSVETCDDHLVRIADHMLLAAALAEGHEVAPALPGIRDALLQVGRAIARGCVRRRLLN